MSSSSSTANTATNPQPLPQKELVNFREVSTEKKKWIIHSKKFDEGV